MSHRSFIQKLVSLCSGRNENKNRRVRRDTSSMMIEPLERRELLAAAFISEVHPSGSSNGSYNADWFEVTNIGATALNITGWQMDDNSNGTGKVPLRGLTSIPVGKSAVFLEGDATGTTDAAIKSSFSTAWFGTSTPPAGFLIGAYGGSGVGLGTTSDAVNLYDAVGALQANVTFGAATTGTTFDNTAGLNNTAISTLSAVGVNGAFLSGGETGSPGSRGITVDLSTYVRIGRYDLPEPTRTSPPLNNLLAQEASGVTYNWDTDSLFIVGDGGKSVTQVSKTGQLIDTMTLALGSSPQGTDFYDPEGITYIGGGKFVMTEERDRQLVQFTYAAGTTLSRSGAQTVKLGTFVDNIGIEGVSYDPQTGGFICVKEVTPEGIFQTGIDFVAGTATNGSPTTVNSIDLFNPSLAGLADFADVFALSNLPTVDGGTSGRLLVLSQASAKIVSIDRTGIISSSLQIVADLGSPLSAADQQHEGLTMDRDGILYVVNENGGGDIDHPQLWVYAPSSAPNQAPTGVALNNTITSLVENTPTLAPIKVADIVVTDDGLGTNNLIVTGTDASFFEITGSGLYIKAGTVLDYETKTSYSVTVSVDDATVGGTPDAMTSYTLQIIDQVNETPVLPAVFISEVHPSGSGNTSYSADWFEVTNNGTTAVNISGWTMDDNSNGTGKVALRGLTSIPAGKSAVFFEGDATGSNDATINSNFSTAWFGSSTPPAGFLIGAYGGSGVGLSTGGDAVNIFDAAGNRVTGVSFGSATTGVTFDNHDGLGSAALPLPTISTLSVVGINSAFLSTTTVKETGSPGTTGKLIISEVAPWSSGNSPVAADWFEVTNLGATTVDISGWKMDDNSESFAGAVALNGITSIAAGESVIFIETANLPGDRATFLSTWFGANPPSGVKIGSYNGSGVGLSTTSDAVNLFDASGALQAKVFFNASPSGPMFPTFDNAAGLNNVLISQLSVVGTNSAIAAVNDTKEIGSPGTIRNYRPVAANDTVSATEDTAVTFNVLTNDTDLNGDTLLISSFTATSNGTLVNNGNGSFTYTANSNVNGNDSFGYTISDGKGGSATATVSITVAEVNDAPSGANDLLPSVVKNSGQRTISFASLLANDSKGPSNESGQTLTITNIGSAAGGVVSMSGTDVLFTPDSNFFGTASFVYTLQDNGTTSGSNDFRTSTATAYFTVRDVSSAAGVTTGPSSSASPYVLPVLSTDTTVDITSILTVGDSVNFKPDGATPYRMVGLPDGLGAFDNGDGTFTLLMNQELGNTAGVNRAHGAKGAFVSSWIVSKSDLSVIAGSDLMQQVYGWNTLTQQSDATTSSIAFTRFCSGDLPAISAFYNATSGLGTQERIYMHGEEGGATGYQVASVATGPDAGKTYVLGKFNLSTNGSGLTGVGGWENALANPFPQDKTIVIGNNDGGTGIMANSVSVYVGTKTNTGSAVDRAGLTNGTLKFVNVTGNAAEIVNTTTRGTNIANGTRFSLSGTASTTFSRPEDGAWNPLDPKQFYFVTTDRLDQVSDGLGTQIGQTRLWRLTFDDITNPDAGGTIDLLIDGRTAGGQKVNMFDNMTVNATTGNVILQEDVGGAAHNGKMWEYNPTTDSLVQIAKHDPARFGDRVGGVTTAATLPFTNDEETSGVIDVSSILGAGSYLFVDQAHYTTGIDSELVEGGQLLLMRLNHAAVAQTSIVTTNEDTARSFAVSDFHFTDLEGNSLVSITVNGLTLASGDTLTVNQGSGPVTVTEGMTITAAQIASLNYTPSLNANGAARSSFGFQVNDAGLGTVTATMTINVTAVNDRPAAHAGSVTTGEDRPVDISLSGSDVETPVGSLIFTITAQPQHGALAINGTQVVYTPVIGYSGPDSFRYTVTDSGDGGSPVLTSNEAIVSIDVISANGQPVVFVGDDPLHPGQSALFVFGTSHDDHIEIESTKQGMIEVEIEGRCVHFEQTYSGPFSRIVVYGQAGDDHIEIEDKTKTEVWVFGGDGDDHIQGGAGANLLMGGTGDDHIQANGSRDLLIGGTGRDHLQAGRGEDILIGGTTSYDADDVALGAIFAAWNSANDDYATRIANLQSSTFAWRLDASSVHDDGESDRLQGGAGLDWFFAHLFGSGKDRVDGLKKQEFVVEI